VSEDQKKQLQTQLWNIANDLRGKMGADEFRDYILGFIFYKYLSEKLELRADALIEELGIRYAQVNEVTERAEEIIEEVRADTTESLGYFLKPTELFTRIAQEGELRDNLIEDLGNVLTNIQNSTMGHASEDDFESLFSEIDLNSPKLGKTVDQRNQLIAKVLVHLDKIDFQLENSEIDVLGDAYEYLISQFASGAGKKAGEFYTPQEVSQVLARIVTNGKERLRSVYDPTAGSGSLLLRVAKYVNDVGMFYGQELNNTTYNLARMNMLLHDVNYSNFDIKQEDTLIHPQHTTLRFEAIVANPPFSANWSADPILLQDERFSGYGRLAPASKADYAFIQHMIYQLDENGTAAIVMPHGVLFRGGAEGIIRRFLIEEKNYLDAVIGLPANLFFGTSIPASILVFKKCRDNPEDVLFIDASKHFEKGKNQNRLRPSDIDKIIDTFRERKEVEKYSHVALLSEIVKNDYNLNIPRYVETFEEEEEVDIDAIVDEIKSLGIESVDLEDKIAVFTKELGMRSPF